MVSDDPIGLSVLHHVLWCRLAAVTVHEACDWIAAAIQLRHGYELILTEEA